MEVNIVKANGVKLLRFAVNTADVLFFEFVLGEQTITIAAEDNKCLIVHGTGGRLRLFPSNCPLPPMINSGQTETITGLVQQIMKDAEFEISEPHSSEADMEVEVIEALREKARQVLALLESTP